MGLNPDSNTLEMPEMAVSELQILLEIAYAGELFARLFTPLFKGANARMTRLLLMT